MFVVLNRKIYQNNALVGSIEKNDELDGWNVKDSNNQLMGIVILLGGGYFGIAFSVHDLPNCCFKSQNGNNLHYP